MWKNSPIVRPAIALIIGAFGMNFFLTFSRPSIYFSFSLLVIAVAGTAAIFYHKKLKKKYGLFGGFAMAAFAMMGAVLFQWNFMNVENASHQGKKLRIGAVITKPMEKNKWWTFRIKEKDGGVDMVYLAKSDSNNKQPDLMIGDSIFILSYFNYPTSHLLRKQLQQQIDRRNIEKEERKKECEHKKKRETTKIRRENMSPERDSANNSGFNLIDDEFEGYKRYLFYQGVSTVAYVSNSAWGYYYDNPEELDKYRNEKPLWHDIAGKMHDQYVKAGFSEDAEAIVDAMTTGNKTAISKETKDKFSKAGISHVLALSGFHLTVIVALLDILLMRGLLKRKWKKWSALIIIPVIWAFAFIAGMPPSLVRATAMCSVVQMALVVGHMQELKNAIGIALFAMLIWNPLQIMDVGFQLSFLSIIGIATVGIPLCQWAKNKVGRWAYFTDIVAISITCTLFTFPLVAYHFGQVPLYSIISNLFVTVIATLFMWTAVMWWIFAWCQFVNSVLTTLLDFLANAMIFTADTVAQLPMATIKYQPNIYEIPCIYFAGALIIMFFKKRKMAYLYYAISIIIITFLLHFAFNT